MSWVCIYSYNSPIPRTKLSKLTSSRSAFEQNVSDPSTGWTPGTPWKKSLIRTRLNSILQCLRDINDGTVSTVADMNAGYWKFEKSQVRRWVTYKGARVFLNCTAHYMLWHGVPQELGVRLVVVEAAREGDAHSAMRMALPSMGTCICIHLF